MVIAVLYARASTEHQNYSTDNQISRLQRYADDHNMTVTNKYVDNGRSGLDLAGRPQMRKLLKDVLEVPRRFDVILIYDVSRWGRFQDSDESAYYEFICKKAGVRIIYTDELFENDESSIANVIKAMKRAMAAEYSRELSYKVQVGRLRMAERGFGKADGPDMG